MARACAVLVGVVIACAALAACTGSVAPQPPATAPTTAEAARVLHALAGAVTGRDGQAFDATLDPSPAAASFRDQQQADFADLAAVPLAQFGYRVLGAVDDASAAAAQRTRLGAPVLLVHVSLDYRLAGVDVEPSSHDQYLTLTRRDGTVYVAGDDALAAASQPSWHGPWSYGPLAAVRGAHSLVLGPPASAATLRVLAGQADAAVTAVTAVWGRGWARTVAVVVAPTAAAFTQLSGGGLVEDSATASTESIDPTSGRAVGQRVYVNPAQLARLTPAGRSVVLRHEITHLASATDTADITPRWLVEGLADYVAYLHSTQPVDVIAAELAARVRRSAAPAALPDGDAFAGTGAAAAYEQAWLACRLIARDHGQAALVRFYRAVGTALEPAAPALAHAFASVLHTTQAAFTTAWRAYLRTSLR